MELEKRTAEGMANKSELSSNGASFPRAQASSDVLTRAFPGQQQAIPADRDIHPFIEDIRLYGIAGQHPPPNADMHDHSFPAPHQPLCPAPAPGQVMTDEQLETLRRQISVYATICQQLVEMHKAIVAQQGSTGLWLGPSIPFDSSLHSMGHKVTSRQRWTPSQAQLHILEELFEQESGTPNKQRIKEITLELSQHGQISETNVYNWFQNRRARTKRKQQLGGANNGDSEFDTDVDLPDEKKGRIEADFSNCNFNAVQATSRTAAGADDIEHQHLLSNLPQRHGRRDNAAMPFIGTHGACDRVNANACVHGLEVSFMV